MAGTSNNRREDSMKRILSLLGILVCLAAPLAGAQESAPETMFVSVTYVKVKPGMEQAFASAMASHLDWHRNVSMDTHYYTVSAIMTGPRTGQYAFSAGPMTGEQMDDADAFSEKDLADWATQGGMGYIESVETTIMRTIPGMGNPPPPEYEPKMAHVIEVDLALGRAEEFMGALRKIDEAEKELGIGADSYSAFTTVASGDSFTKRYVVNWVEGWGDDGGENPENQEKLVEALGGEEAMQELMEQITRAVRSNSVTTFRVLKQFSHWPPM